MHNRGNGRDNDEVTDVTKMGNGRDMAENMSERFRLPLIVHQVMDISLLNSLSIF